MRRFVTALGSCLGGAVLVMAGCSGGGGASPGPSMETIGDAAPGDAALGDAGSPPGDDSGACAGPTISKKVDILFDVDNSAGMGDKQAYLAEAIPDFVARLVTPNCIDANGVVTGHADASGKCAAGSTPEFAPVHDLHIGIVSSSLGPRLGNACLAAADSPVGSLLLPSGQKLDRHNDDHGHLIDRAVDPTMPDNYTETPLGAAEPWAFLNWFPSLPSNAGVKPTGPTPITDGAALASDLQKIVLGTHQFGCGIESQLESWYRFLIQPDPYDTLTTKNVGNGPIAEWQGVDTTILAQRALFLRPDSLVVVVVVSDENDSEVDVRSFGGSGYFFMNTMFKPPRGTSACQAHPEDTTNCTSCLFNKFPNDPECKTNGGVYSDPTDWGFDLNLRHVHERQKYGADVQFPIQRYVLGLTSKVVPNRDGEYPPDSTTPGAYATAYQGGVTGAKDNLNCTNPLFAAKLPLPPKGTTVADWQPDPKADLCNLPVGPRTPDQIYYAHIGGVPHELLQVDPAKTDSASQAQKAKLTDSDWKLILGARPLIYDYSGIDQHMIEDYKSRTAYARPPNGGFPVSDTPGGDPIAGNEWVTNSTMPMHQGLTVDRQYACIFKLKDVRHCDSASVRMDPTLGDTCDCQPPRDNTGATTFTTFTPQELPPVCDQKVQTDQLYAKVYPTIRELLLAKLLGEVSGSNEGIISSLCPIHTVDAMNGNDPLYGYRPAVNAIVDRIKGGLEPASP